MHIGWNMAAYMGARATKDLDLVSHNLANAGTAGFKRQIMNQWRLEAPELAAQGRQRPAAYVDVLRRDFSQGPLHETMGETDLAIQGPGFFKVQTPQGVRYTRNGCFQLNGERQLVTREGYPVVGAQGPVTLNSIDQKFGIDEQGGIHLDGSMSGQLTVVDFAHPQGLRAEGRTYYAATAESGEEQEAKGSRILQGKIEESNVDQVAEAVNMIDIQRSYEAYLKVLDTFAGSDRKVIEEVGLSV
jgi:flagellar basal-body rod protein FlgG